MTLTELRPGLNVRADHLLEVLGVEGAALRYNPGSDSRPDECPDDSPPMWEVWLVNESPYGRGGELIGFGASPGAAMLDAAAGLLGWEDDEGCIFAEEHVTVDLQRVRNAVTAVQRFLREVSE